MKIKIEMNDTMVGDMEEIIKTCGFKDYQELFNNSLTLLRYVVEKRAEGETIGMINESKKKYVTLEMPFMANINKNKH